MKSFSVQLAEQAVYEWVRGVCIVDRGWWAPFIILSIGSIHRLRLRAFCIRESEGRGAHHNIFHFFRDGKTFVYRSELFNVPKIFFTDLKTILMWFWTFVVVIAKLEKNSVTLYLRVTVVLVSIYLSVWVDVNIILWEVWFVRSWERGLQVMRIPFLISYWQMFQHKTDIYCEHQSYQERSEILSLKTKCHLAAF